MDDDIRRIFEQEIREKKVSARGASKKKGRRGLVGKMVTPADFSGREYRKPGDLSAFNFNDFITKLSQAPTLKEVLLARMDEEHKNYRQATERTIDAVAELVKVIVEPIAHALWETIDRVEVVETALASTGLAEVKERRARGGAGRRAGGESGSAGAGAGSAGGPTVVASSRIRWGATPGQIRPVVAQQLQRLCAEGKNIDTKTIRAEVPSLLKWLYGKKAVFSGLEDAKRFAGLIAAAASAAAPGAEAGEAAGPSGS
ncbi:MAG: hypothetical protein ACYC41_11780 [Bacillota bacterium]